MSALSEVVMFLLAHHVKNGDAHTSAQAKRLMDKLNEEFSASEALVAALPHQGSQSPQPKSPDGLGAKVDPKDAQK